MLLRDVQDWASVCFYAVPGTEAGYGARRSASRRRVPRSRRVSRTRYYPLPPISYCMLVCCYCVVVQAPYDPTLSLNDRTLSPFLWYDAMI